MAVGAFAFSVPSMFKMAKKQRRRGAMSGLLALILSLVGWLGWEVGPGKAIWAISTLSDPAKLATLGERGANSRLNKIVHWLHHASQRGARPAVAIEIGQQLNQTGEPRKSLVRDSLLRNMKIAEELGCLTRENLDRMRQGKGPEITRGPYKGQLIEIDHIVPLSLAPEVGNELANLEMMPASLNRRKSNQVGERQLSHAKKLLEAGLLTQESFDRVRAKAAEIGGTQSKISRPQSSGRP